MDGTESESGKKLCVLLFSFKCVLIYELPLPHLDVFFNCSLIFCSNIENGLEDMGRGKGKLG